MNSSTTRNWKVLSWNVRGINSQSKWDALRDKITESECDVICFQETKKEAFDLQFIRKFCPSAFDSFEFLPSVGASGGMLVAWKGSLFTGIKIFSNAYAISVEFTSLHNLDKWLLTNVYGPCTSDGKVEFTNWLKNINMLEDVDWILLGDFNLIRKHENRNRVGGNVNDMFLFNEAISRLGLVEIPLQGKKFTWSNMQPSPLLEKLDWVFTSLAWTLSYPGTSVKALSIIPSDHCPCVVSISTSIPRGKIFRFENYWLSIPTFQQLLLHNWSHEVPQGDSAKRLTAKFKSLRKAIKDWQRSLSPLKNTITNIKLVTQFLDLIEEFRDLNLEEWNFRVILKEELLSLLEQQKTYWKQRGAIKWVKFGDASTHFFHANATIRYRKNLIASLESDSGEVLQQRKFNMGSIQR